MKLRMLLDSVKKTIFFIAFALLLGACDNQQGMMHGSGDSISMGNWNWIQVLIGIIIGFVLGYLLAGRRK